MTKVNSLFVIAASIWHQWTLESSAAYLMLKSLSSGIGYHTRYRCRTLITLCALRTALNAVYGSVARAGQAKMG